MRISDWSADVCSSDLGLGVGGALSWRWGEEWLPLVVVGAVLAGAGFAAAIRGWELSVRTPQGSGLWLRVESFRRFLAQSEAFHAEEAAKRGVLSEYTAWAVAVSEIDRWGSAVSQSAAHQHGNQEWEEIGSRYVKHAWAT